MDYCEQAIKIPNGKTKWTPDFVILYKNGKRQIIEVKSISELRGEEKDELFKKFLNAENWAQKNGYEFQVVTELNLKKSNRVFLMIFLISERIGNIEELMYVNSIIVYYLKYANIVIVKSNIGKLGMIEI